jgi:la-related protein 1
MLVLLQGDQIRKRDKWSDWIPASKKSTSAETIGDGDKDSPKSITSGDNFGNPSKGSSKPTVSDFSSEGAQSSRTNNYKSGNLKSSADEKRNVEDLSNDFSNTFLLDEELDLEHRSPRKSGLSMSKR